MKTIVRTAPNGDVTTVIDMGDDVPDPVAPRQTIFKDKRDEQGNVVERAPSPQDFVGKRFDAISKEISVQAPPSAELMAEIQQRVTEEK